MKIKLESKQDIPSRLKFTQFEDDSFVSTVNNNHPIQDELALMRNQVYGNFNYETAYNNGTTFVIFHTDNKKQAIKNHTKAVNLKLKGFKDWEKLFNKAFETLLRREK